MIAWKFTRDGAVGPFSGVGWPEAGTWLYAGGNAVSPCSNAVHACALEDLPLWLDDELWRVELSDSVLRSHGKLAASAGRLIERVETWNAATAAEYADACVERASLYTARLSGDVATALVADAAVCARRARREESAAPTMAAGAALCAARVAGLADSAGIAAERAWQACWLADRVGLDR